MDRFKDFNATGIAPDGRLYAGDLNLFQDLVVALADFTQDIEANSITVGTAGLTIDEFGATTFGMAGSVRVTQYLMAIGGYVQASYTTTARNAIVSPPALLVIFNSTTGQFEYNAGSPGTPNWQTLVPVIGTGSVTTAMIADLAITTIKLADKAVTLAKVADALRPSQAALTTDEALRALGTGAGNAAAGNDPRFGSSAKKTSTVTVNTTVTETDLLAGELDLAAGVLGVTNKARITAWGDLKNNSGATITFPRFKFKLGGTTLIDTGAVASILAADATRRGWKIVIDILELNATNAQFVSFEGNFRLLNAQAVSFGNHVFTTGEGMWSGGGASGSALPNTGQAFGSNTGALNAALALAVVLSVINGSANAQVETRLLGAALEIV